MVTGQEKICNLIEKSTLDTFPRSLILVGPSGSGKHLLCNEIARKFQLHIFDITEMLNIEIIDEIYSKVEPYIYVIRLNEISVKEENTILKFLEEPLKNSYIILLAEYTNGVLPTILNRCQVWHLQNYSKNYLSTFTNGNDLLLDIVETPGQAIALANESFTEMLDLADKMICKIASASIPNTLSISDKFAWTNEKNKFNYDLFLKVLLFRLVSYCKGNTDPRLLEYYYLTTKLVKNSQIKNIDKKYLLEKYLLEARSIMKGSLV